MVDTRIKILSLELLDLGTKLQTTERIHIAYQVVPSRWWRIENWNLISKYRLYNAIFIKDKFWLFKQRSFNKKQFQAISTNNSTKHRDEWATKSDTLIAIISTFTRFVS